MATAQVVPGQPTRLSVLITNKSLMPVRSDMCPINLVPIDVCQMHVFSFILQAGSGSGTM